MATMHKEFNARFLIGLPLWRPDSVDMARKMMKLAEQYLPADAIIGYELGNEVIGQGVRQSVLIPSPSLPFLLTMHHLATPMHLHPPQPNPHPPHTPPNPLPPFLTAA